MYLATLPIDAAIGHILRHNLADHAGHKLLSKGRRLTADNVAQLRALGIETVRVAVLEPGDVHEDEAARRLAEAVCGPGVIATPAVHSRVNLLAEADGVVEVDAEALLAINDVDGLTIATLANHTLVRARQRVATIKIIPFAVREEELARAEQTARARGSVVGLRPLRPTPVGVLLVSSPAARGRVERGVYPAIEARVTALGSTIVATRFVPPDERAVAAAIEDLRSVGARLLIVAGETSIMDRDDVTPQGIRAAGGHIEHYGAPVEPGNLLLLAYLDGPGDPLPVLGAPGCVRSRDINIVDLLLPRLLAGERVTRRDIVELGHGGLLASR
ncbi:MAG: molybdopterin-binding protein [Chloroflexota bacterium]